MIDDKYAKAYVEVLEIISHFPEEEYNKIPKEKIDFYKENMDKEYVFSIDPEIDLEKQNISKEASAIIVTIFRDYFATETQKKKIEDLLEANRRKVETEKREKYNPDDVFKKKEKENEKNEGSSTNLPMEIKKQNFFQKFINYIKRIFSHK